MSYHVLVYKMTEQTDEKIISRLRMDSKEKISANISKNHSRAYNTASGRVVLYLRRDQT